KKTLNLHHQKCKHDFTSNGIYFPFIFDKKLEKKRTIGRGEELVDSPSRGGGVARRDSSDLITVTRPFSGKLSVDSAVGRGQHYYCWGLAFEPVSGQFLRQVCCF